MVSIENFESTNVSAANVIFRQMEQEFECCGVNGPGDYLKMGSLMKLLRKNLSKLCSFGFQFLCLNV